MYTIFGNTGFIGSELVNKLQARGENVFTPDRNYIPETGRDLGNVIYCIGLTSDFRVKQLETVEAHVNYLTSVLKNSQFSSFVYLSSTRVYKRVESGFVDEESDLIVNPNSPDDLYNISKLMGESICLSSKTNNIKVARLSNVVGFEFESENFLSSIIKQAIHEKKIILNTGLQSAKDYIFINDVVDALIDLNKGKHKIYNIASGKNITTSAIINELRKYLQFELHVTNSDDFSFPEININRAKIDLNLVPTNIISKLEQIIKKYKNENYN